MILTDSLGQDNLKEQENLCEQNGDIKRRMEVVFLNLVILSLVVSTYKQGSQ